MNADGAAPRRGTPARDLVIWFAETGGAWIAVDAAIMDARVEY